MIMSRINKMAKTLLAAVAILSSATAMPAYADTAVGVTKIAILRPLSFFITDQLNFGTVMAGTTAGDVVLAPDGTRTSTGGVILMGNSHQPAVFAGLGSFNQRIDISISSNTINLTGPGAPMQVKTWVIGSTPTALLTTSPLRFRIRGAGGAFQFPLGATLRVGANQLPGVYTGNYTITLVYQ